MIMSYETGLLGRSAPGSQVYSLAECLINFTSANLFLAP